MGCSVLVMRQSKLKSFMEILGLLKFVLKLFGYSSLSSSLGFPNKPHGALFSLNIYSLNIFRTMFNTYSTQMLVIFLYTKFNTMKVACYCLKNTEYYNHAFRLYNEYVCFVKDVFPMTISLFFSCHGRCHGEH